METQQPGAPVKKPSRLLKFLKRFFLWSIILFFVLILSGALLAYIYEDEIKELALKELGKNLNTELIIDTRNIDFSVIRDFPYASLEFRDVKALDAIVAQKKDTLFKAGSITFRFSIIDIFNKNYRIKKVEVSDVTMKLWVDKKGKDNYHFLKQSADTSSAEVSFELEKFLLSNVSIFYLDHRNRSDHAFVIKQGELSGNFSSDNYTLETSGDIFIDHLRTDSTTWVSSNTLNLQAELQVDNSSGTYTIRSSEAKLSDLVLDVSGSVQDAGKALNLDLAMKGRDLDIQSMLSLLPGRFKEKVKDYESSGTMYLESKIKGPLSGTQDPIVSIDFGISKGEITQVSSNVTLKNVDLKGSFVNGYTEKQERNYLDIERFTARVAEGSVDGRCRISGFSDPVIDASANANIELADLQKFLAIDTIESITGQLKLNASFKGKIKDPKAYLADDFENAKTTGQMTVKDATLRLKNNNLSFDSLDAYFLFSNNDIEINNFSGNISGNDFRLRGFFRNILAWAFLEKQDLTVDASLRSEKLNLETFLKDKTDESAKTADYKVQFSEHINFNLESEIGYLKFKKFEANNIRGTIRLKDKQVTANPLLMETMGGTVKVSGMVDGTKEENLLVTCEAAVKKIDISRLFYQLENFGQDYITDKHLRGTANGDITFASVCSPALEIDPAKVYASSNIKIEQGELIGFKPLRDLTDFIKKDITLFFLKVDELEKRLDHVKFATLENTIEIRDQVITIPDMIIKSTAMDIGFAGTHSFRDDINYKFSFLIRELLISSDREKEKKNTEFGVVEDDGHYQFPLYLLMKGTVDKYKITRDKQAVKEKRKEELKKEKESLKQILREEFGWFKKDSTKTKKDDKGDDKFNLNWNENKPLNKDDKKKRKEDDLEGEDF